MFILLLFTLWICMIMFSTYVGVKNSHLYEVKAMVNFTKTGVYNYTFGIHHSAVIGQDRKGGKFRIDTLSIGVILISVEINFYKQLEKGPIDPQQN